ncbi:MAG TPA: hypothetical protein VI756_13250 [Blastocatellia bacterium]
MTGAAQVLSQSRRSRRLLYWQLLTVGMMVVGYFREAIALRRWDDQAKVPSMLTPGLETYLEMLHACRID